MDKNSRIKLRLQHLIISIFYKQMFNLHTQLNGHKLVEDRGALKPHTTSRMSWCGFRSVVPAMDKFTQTIGSVEEKGWCCHSLKRRAPGPLPLQAFIAFLGTLHWVWSSFSMHRFTLGSYRKQRRGCCQLHKKGRIFAKVKKKWLSWLHCSLEGLA